VPIFGFIFGFIFLVLFRNLLRFSKTTLFLYKIGLTDVVLVGNTPMTEELTRLLKNSQQSGLPGCWCGWQQLNDKKISFDQTV